MWYLTTTFILNKKFFVLLHNRFNSYLLALDSLPNVELFMHTIHYPTYALPIIPTHNVLRSTQLFLYGICREYIIFKHTSLDAARRKLKMSKFVRGYEICHYIMTYIIFGFCSAHTITPLCMELSLSNVGQFCRNICRSKYYLPYLNCICIFSAFLHKSFRNYSVCINFMLRFGFDTPHFSEFRWST